MRARRSPSSWGIPLGAPHYCSRSGEFVNGEREIGGEAGRGEQERRAGETPALLGNVNGAASAGDGAAPRAIQPTSDLVPAMRFVLDIDYPVEKMERSRRRMEAGAAFRYVDRVSVGFCLVPRYFTPIFGLPYRAIFASAEEQFHWQLQFLKYRIENIPEDIVCTSPTVSVGPYFDNVLDSGAFGAEVVWPENETLHCRPTIQSVEAMARFEPPAPATGLWGQARDWWQEMRELAGKTKLTFNGVEGRVDVALLGISGLSPHMIAVDLVGGDFYWWQIEYRKECHAFLAKIADGLIEAKARISTKPWWRTCESRASTSSATLSSQRWRRGTWADERSCGGISTPC
jgi:hypothetical protein